MKNPFVATQYKGKPAVYDKVARVYYFGYRSAREASQKADDLNNGR